MRFRFGGQGTDLAILDPATTGGQFVLILNGAGGTAFDQSTGGSQYTELVQVLGGGAAITSDGSGFIREFDGPDGIREMWAGLPGGRRVYLRGRQVGFPTDILSVVGPITGTPGLPGIPGVPGIPGLTSYQLWLSQGNSGTLADFQATETGPQGAPGPAAAQYTPAWDLGITSGNRGKFLSVLSASPNGEKVLLIQVDLDVPTTTAATYNLVVDSGSGPVNKFPVGSEITIAAGQMQAVVQPSTITLPVGAKYAISVVTAPSTGSSSTPGSSYVASTQYGNGLTATASTFPLTLPSGGMAGDRVIVAVPETTSQTKVKMADSRFTEVVRTASAVTTPQLSGLLFEAPWSSDLACTIQTFNSTDGTTAVLRMIAAVAVIERGSSVNYTQASMSSPGDAQGPTLVSPSVIASPAAGSGFYFDFIKIPSGTAALTAPTDGPSGSSTIQNPVTNHPTANNTGVVVRTFGPIASGGTIAATTFAWTSATTITTMTQVGGPVTFPAGAAVVGVTKTTAFVATQRL